MKRNSLTTAVVAGIAGVAGLASPVSEDLVNEEQLPTHDASEDRSARPVVVSIEERRRNEIAEYEKQYKNPAYRMGAARKRDVQKMLERLYITGGGGSVLDVGCGRGEALEIARACGFHPVRGTEVVPELMSEVMGVGYAEAHQMHFDDGQFDHVLCIDTLEHLLPEDVPRAIVELWRVAGKTLTISASTRPSHFGGGRDLHISARPEAEWNATFFAAINVLSSPCGTLGGTPVWRFVKPDPNAEFGLDS